MTDEELYERVRALEPAGNWPDGVLEGAVNMVKSGCSVKPLSNGDWAYGPATLSPAEARALLVLHLGGQLLAMFGVETDVAEEAFGFAQRLYVPGSGKQGVATDLYDRSVEDHAEPEWWQIAAATGYKGASA